MEKADFSDMFLVLKIRKEVTNTGDPAVSTENVRSKMTRVVGLKVIL